MFFCDTRFVDKGATSSFEGGGKDTSGKDKWNKVIKGICPSWMKAGKEVESESIEAGF